MVTAKNAQKPDPGRGKKRGRRYSSKAGKIRAAIRERLVRLTARIGWEGLLAAAVAGFILLYPLLKTYPPAGSQPLFTGDTIYPPWDPDHYCGRPLLDACNVNIIDRILDSLLPPSLFFAFNQLLFLAGLLLLENSKRSAWKSAILTSAVLLFHPFILAAGNAVWLVPLTLFLCNKLQARRTVTLLVPTAVLFAWQILRGPAEVTGITLLLIAFYAVQDGMRMARAKRLPSLCYLLAALGLGLILASVRWLPALAAGGDVIRPGSDGTAAVSPLVLLSLFHSSVTTGLIPGTPLSLYTGTAAMALAACAMIRSERMDIRWHLALFFAALAACTAVPKAAASFQIIMLWALARLAGSGWTALGGRRPGKKIRRIRIFVYILLSFSAALLLLLLLMPSTFYTVSSHLGTISHRSTFYQGALIDGWIALGVLLAVLALLNIKRRPVLVAALFLLLVMGESWLTGRRAVYPAAGEIGQAEAIERIFNIGVEAEGQSLLGEGGARLGIFQEFLNQTGFDRVADNPFVDKFWRLGIRENEIVPLMVPLPNLPQDRSHFENAMLDLLNVQTVVSRDLPVNDPDYQLVSGEGSWHYRNRTALPRLFFVDSVAVLSGAQRIYHAMRSIEFDPARFAFVERQPPFRRTDAGERRATILSYSRHRILAEAESEGRSILLISELYYPEAWRVYINGQRSVDFKANALVRALFLPSGRHRIEWIYRPPLLVTGSVLSLLTVVLLLALLVTQGWQRWRGV